MPHFVDAIVGTKKPLKSVRFQWFFTFNLLINFGFSTSSKYTQKPLFVQVRYGFREKD